MKKYILRIFRSFIWFCTCIYKLCKTTRKDHKRRDSNSRDVNTDEEVL